MIGPWFAWKTANFVEKPQILLQKLNIFNEFPLKRPLIWQSPIILLQQHFF